MMAIVFRWIVSLLVWLSADPHQLEHEPARAAAAVAAARATVVAQTAVRDRVESVEESKPKPIVSGSVCLSGTCKRATR